MRAPTTAERIAARFGDRATFLDDRDYTLDRIAHHHGAVSEIYEAVRDPETGEVIAADRKQRGALMPDDLIRYQFPDGSAIVAGIESWEIEGRAG